MQVLRVLPIAHKYAIDAVIKDAVLYAASFTYDSGSAITFLELSSRLQVGLVVEGFSLCFLSLRGRQGYLAHLIICRSLLVEESLSFCLCWLSNLKVGGEGS